jgi:hypothetical protein
VKRLVGFIGMTVGGWLGWFVGSRISFFTGLLVSIVGSGVGMYAVQRWLRDFLS